MRDTLANARAKVDEHKASGAYEGFETLEDRKSFLGTYADGSMVQTLIDILAAYDGSPRVIGYTPGSMTAQNKEDTGVDQINSDLFTIYSHANSYIVHEGEVGNTIWQGGAVFWLPCTGANTEDFLKYKQLLERHMAYSYIALHALASEDGYSTEAEIEAAQDDYEDFRDNSL